MVILLVFLAVLLSDTVSSSLLAHTANSSHTRNHRSIVLNDLILFHSTRSSKISVTMVQILIPSSAQKQCKNRTYTVYNIELYLSSRCHKIDRRYSEFHELHRVLKKSFQFVPSLPPKKVNNLNKKLIEQRRTSLEKYLQSLLKTIGLNKAKELNDFLNVPFGEPQPSGQNLRRLDQHRSIFRPYLVDDEETRHFAYNYHQCMIEFKNDYLFSIDYDLPSYLPNSSICSDSSSNKSSCETSSCASSSSSTVSSLPDIVVMGALDAIYK